MTQMTYLTRVCYFGVAYNINFLSAFMLWVLTKPQKETIITAVWTSERALMDFFVSPVQIERLASNGFLVVASL